MDHSQSHNNPVSQVDMLTPPPPWSRADLHHLLNLVRTNDAILTQVNSSRAVSEPFEDSFGDDIWVNGFPDQGPHGPHSAPDRVDFMKDHIFGVDDAWADDFSPPLMDNMGNLCGQGNMKAPSPAPTQSTFATFSSQEHGPAYSITSSCGQPGPYGYRSQPTSQETFFGGSALGSQQDLFHMAPISSPGIGGGGVSVDPDEGLGSLISQDFMEMGAASKSDFWDDPICGKSVDFKSQNLRGRPFSSPGVSVDGNGEKTLMIRGIPCSLTQENMMQMLDDAGFAGKYNFFYMPRFQANLGYAFVNFLDEVSAERCQVVFDGRKLNPLSSQKVCTISRAHIQGLAKLKKLFRRKKSEAPFFLDEVQPKNGAVKFPSSGPHFLQ